MIQLRPYQWVGPYAQMRSPGAVHDPGLCADVRCDWMPPGERLIVRACEIVGYPQAYLYDDHTPPADPEGRGRCYEHTSFQWQADGAPARLWADCAVGGRGRFALSLEARADCIDLHLSVRNDTAAPMGPIDWAFCVIALECPMLRNPEHDRTFVFDGRRLRSFREINGATGIHILPIAGAGGFIPAIHDVQRPGAAEAQASVVIVQGREGRHTAALGFEQSYASYGCTGNMCFHADPYFGTLTEPGQEKRMHGRLYLIEGDAEAAFERYRRDFKDS